MSHGSCFPIAVCVHHLLFMGLFKKQKSFYEIEIMCFPPLKKYSKLHFLGVINAITKVSFKYLWGEGRMIIIFGQGLFNYGQAMTFSDLPSSCVLGLVALFHTTLALACDQKINKWERKAKSAEVKPLWPYHHHFRHPTSYIVGDSHWTILFRFIFYLFRFPHCLSIATKGHAQGGLQKDKYTKQN